MTQASDSGIAQTLTVDGCALHFVEAGAGAPVVLLHGWGSSSAGFNVLIRHLAPNFHVYALDLPGFGATSAPEVPWTLNDYVELVKAFLKIKNLERPALIGHSFGGRLSICLGAQGLASKLILADAAGVKPKRKPQYYFKVYAYKLARKLLDLLPAGIRGPLLERLQRTFGSEDYRNADPVLRQTLVQVVNEDLTPLLSKIDVPVLLLWGENDDATPLYQAKIMERAIPDAGLVVLKGAGHYSFLDNPGEFNIIAAHFLRH